MTTIITIAQAQVNCDQAIILAFAFAYTSENEQVLTFNSHHK